MHEERDDIEGEIMMEVGRLCMKIAGRDAGRKCVIVDILDKNKVLIDGQTRRRPCNIGHLEPLRDVVKLKKNASHADVVSAFKTLKLEMKEKKPKKAAAASKPKKKRLMSQPSAPVSEAKEKKGKQKK